MPTATPAVSAGSLEQWFEEYQALDGHFAEREAYIRKADGKHVQWTVQVLAVWTNTQNVAVSFRSTNPSDLGGPVSVALFDLKQKERIYALQAKEVIEIDGVLKAMSDNLAMELIADDFRLVRSISSH